MYICRHYTVLSLQSIGNAVGGKDHTTVINGINRVEAKINDDYQFKSSVEAIIKKLNLDK
jgi:chromosomal replication initiator protein